MIRSPLFALVLTCILACVLVLACNQAPLRRNAARTTWGQAQTAQVAAVAELTKLGNETQAALVQPPRTREQAMSQLGRFRAARQSSDEALRQAQVAMDAAAVEMALRGPPEGLEAAARAAAAAARRLEEKLQALRVVAAQLLAEPIWEPRTVDGGADGGAPADGGVR